MTEQTKETKMCAHRFCIQMGTHALLNEKLFLSYLYLSVSSCLISCVMTRWWPQNRKSMQDQLIPRNTLTEQSKI